jgi:hypothetical protein
MVKDGRMPRPKKLSDKRIAWDVRALDVAVDQLPAETADAATDESWSDVDAPQAPAVRRTVARSPRQGSGLFPKGQRPAPAVAGWGSDEFNAAYPAALLGQPAPVRDRFVRAAPGTLAALIASYMKSAEYIGLRDTSKAGYISRLEMLRTVHGHRTVAGLSRERIITGILQPYADRPGAALDTLKKLRTLIRHATNIEWLKHDPSLGINGRLAPSSAQPSIFFSIWDSDVRMWCAWPTRISRPKERSGSSSRRQNASC